MTQPGAPAGKSLTRSAASRPGSPRPPPRGERGRGGPHDGPLGCIWPPATQPSWPRGCKRVTSGHGHCRRDGQGGRQPLRDHDTNSGRRGLAAAIQAHPPTIPAWSGPAEHAPTRDGHKDPRGGSPLNRDHGGGLLRSAPGEPSPCQPPPEHPNLVADPPTTTSERPLYPMQHPRRTGTPPARTHTITRLSIQVTMMRAGRQPRAVPGTPGLANPLCTPSSPPKKTPQTPPPRRKLMQQIKCCSRPPRACAATAPTARSSNGNGGP